MTYPIVAVPVIAPGLRDAMSVKASGDILSPFQQMLFCVPTLGQALLQADSWWRKQTIGKQIDSISGKCVKRRETVRQQRYKQRSYITEVQRYVLVLI